MGFWVASTRKGSADGDLALLHGFEQRGLHLGGGAVDLVRQHQIREDRPPLDAEAGVPGVEDLRADHVGGQHVRCKLDAREAGVDGSSQRLHRQGLGQARQALEQDVAAAQEAHEQPLNHCLLAHQHLADLTLQRAAELRLLLIDLCFHRSFRHAFRHACSLARVLGSGCLAEPARTPSLRIRSGLFHGSRLACYSTYPSTRSCSRSSGFRVRLLGVGRALG